MATANVRNIIRLPGRICYGATNLNAAFPHGGTALGICRDMVFNFGYKTDVATAEEFGGVVTKAYYAGEKPYMAAVLREFDNDALSKVFPNTSVGTVTQDRVVNLEADAGNRAGYDLTTGTYKLIFSPFAATRHPFIVIYYAIPALEESAQLNMSLTKEVGIGVVWWAGLNSGNQCYSIGKAADLQAML